MAHLIVPVGTMVVTSVELRTIGADRVRAAGSAGRIVGAPTDGQHAYRVRFPSGDEVMARRKEFAVLKEFQEIGFEAAGAVLAEYDLYQHVVYRCVVGSRAFGLARDGSDVDRRGIYVPPADLHWSLYGVPEQLENDATQEVYWEIQKFVTLALKANPNILECLNSPMVEHVSETGQDLLDNRDLFLSKLAYQTYNRYVMSQFKKLSRKMERDGAVNWKHAMHLVRLLMSGIVILRERIVPVDVSALTGALPAGVPHGDVRATLLAIRDAEVPWADVNRWRLALHDAMDEAYEGTSLPERPDYVAANELLLRARRAALA